MRGAGRDGTTDDEQDVGVLRLHARRDARVFVAGKVLGVDHGDDCVQRERARGLALEVADLECERRGEGRAAASGGNTVCERRILSRQIPPRPPDASERAGPGPYEDSMIIRSGWYFSALGNQNGVYARYC